MLTYAELSVLFNKLVTERDGEWCGIPMPLPGLGLVLEDRHPGKARLAELQAIIDGPDELAAREKAAAETDADIEATRAKYEDSDLMGWREVNRWRGQTLRGAQGHIVMLRHRDGRTTYGLDADAPRRKRMLLSAFETLDAWNLETELTAMDQLADLVTDRQFKMYVLLGQFLWTSKRSGLTYFFRRLQPTVVMTPHDPRDSQMRVLTCLCLHPIGYYAATRCGALTPTDDVIAHYVMARADEHLFWKRANQHSPLAPESGL